MTGRRLLTLSWLWVALLVSYLVWGGIAQAGLYYWVGTVEIDRLGSYQPILTGLVPGFLLGLPALWYIGREARRRRLAPPDPAAAARTLRRFAIVMIGLGVLGYAVAATCYVAAQGLPSGGGRATSFDAAALGNGPPPAGRISLAGTADERAEANVTDGSRFTSWTTSYAGFRAAGETDKGGPFRIFVERRIRDDSGAVPIYVGHAESGYLIENGLPPLARYALERQGVRIAAPHYLLRTGSDALRTPYYVGAALGVLFGSMLVGIGTLLLILPPRGARNPGPARPGWNETR